MKTLVIFLRDDKWFARINDGNGSHEFFTGLYEDTESFDVVEKFMKLNPDYDIKVATQIILKLFGNHWFVKAIGLISFNIPSLDDNAPPKFITQFKSYFMETPFHKFHGSKLVVDKFKKHNPREKIILIEESNHGNNIERTYTR